MNAPARIVSTPERVRLSVDDFLLLNDGGAFADYTKTELIDGEIWGMNAQHLPHARVKSRLLVELALWARSAGGDLEAISEVTVRVTIDSAPEPDIVLTRRHGGRELPAEAVALVVEVADTTLGVDLGRKAELYATAGVPEYWVVDVNGGRVVRHDGPDGGRYRHRSEVALGRVLRSATVDDLEIDTAALAA